MSGVALAQGIQPSYDLELPDEAWWNLARAPSWPRRMSSLGRRGDVGPVLFFNRERPNAVQIWGYSSAQGIYATMLLFSLGRVGLI